MRPHQIVKIVRITSFGRNPVLLLKNSKINVCDLCRGVNQMDEPPEIEKESKEIIFLYKEDWIWLIKTYKEFNNRLTDIERDFIKILSFKEDDSSPEEDDSDA